MKFEWDEKKNSSNYKKHRVRFEEVCYVFNDPYALNKFDEEHSDYEERWIMIGKSILIDKVLVIVHTYRKINEEEFVRIISARKATGKEKRVYLERAKP